MIAVAATRVGDLKTGFSGVNRAVLPDYASGADHAEEFCGVSSHHVQSKECVLQNKLHRGKMRNGSVGTDCGIELIGP